jgi:hypothetical protein
MSYIDAAADGGVRILQNQYSSPTLGLRAYETDRPVAHLGLDSAGNFSYHHIQPSSQGTGLYSGTGSQTLVISGLGFDANNYAESIAVDIMTMQGGRYMRFRTCATTNNPLPVIEFQNDQSILWYQKMTGPASTAGRAPFRIPPGVAPSSPVDGDIWTTSAGLFVRINGSTVGPLS